MENQDDLVYCKLLAEVLENCEKQLQKETLEFNRYMEEREKQEKCISEAIAEEYNKVLNKIQDSYETLVRHVEKELDRALLQQHTKTQLTLDQKLNESLRDIELELQSAYNKLVAENETLHRQFDKEWYEVDKLRLELLKINTEIEKYTKPREMLNEKMVFMQFHIDQINNKNKEIIQLYDRLSQNLLNKITQIQEDIQRMEHLCNYLNNDDVTHSVNNPLNFTTSDCNNRSTRSNIGNLSDDQDTSIDYEAVD